MKIYLFAENKVFAFFLPKKVIGSFSFDENPQEEIKLINIEARDNKWVLYSTIDSFVISGGGRVMETPIENNSYYIVSRNNKNYVIYVTDLFDDSFSNYAYDKNINLVIGNDTTCNVNFNCSYIKGVCATIKYEENALFLTKEKDAKIYVNDQTIKFDKIVLNIGDKLNIYGLKLIVLNGTLLLNNPGDNLSLNTMTAGIAPKSIKNIDVPKDIEVRDVDLYSKEDYFSKAPRIRRVIKTKEIDLSPPPKQEGESKLPLILTIGPMITMGIVSSVMLINTIVKITSGTTTLSSSWSTIVSSSAMLISTLLWPNLTRVFNKKLREQNKKELIEKYTKYLDEKRDELREEAKLQKDILIENLIPISECLSIIKVGKVNFWDKRIEQSDFLDVRIGYGNELLDAKVNYPEEGFTIDEDELRKQADKLVEEFKYINDVPIGYSLYKSKITALMGNRDKCYGLMSNIILQLVTFYSYEDIKFVIFTNSANESKWNYLRYMNHTFSNNKAVRFFASSTDEIKALGEVLNQELQNRVASSEGNSSLFKPYYIVISDDYNAIKRLSFIKNMTELDINIGFSLVIIEDSLSRLPSKCSNFITLGEVTSGILRNSYEEQEQVTFKDEIDYSVNMMSVAKRISNIPIEFQEGNKQLPDAITFLEMEHVGKVEQLNILNRWETNDSTQSLKAEVGVDSEGDLMYLDLHEKFHGPHGLIAGMTGSGKSEFIITYILSMAINYSPDDVSFILIDYKGGGLAFAFENKTTGVSLPHLAGTITNLDKAEMDRTLVSIDSEIKRRQKIFNLARDSLGESTMDIYKYQRLFKEGRLAEPVPHLFIICDEFAELKSQQPDFMDNLISVARIGRSLGVHLILATQKPSGVVNDQIWSNTKFRVCLKVQDASDSKEMLKRPDAASLKQTGRFYLQVGYDEYFALGQSGWCGAKYYPSEQIVKQVDKSINFIDNIGNHIKSIQAGNNIKIEAQGEQLAAIMKSIIEASKLTNKRARKLWLNNIDAIILVDNLMKKYDVKLGGDVTAIIGEYDAPENQEQGLLTYSFKDGNTAIYGNDEIEREGLLYTIIYSSCISYTADKLNIYIVDYGSESLRMFAKFPQVGGMVFVGDNEEFGNLFKLIEENIKKRKKLLIPYGGSFDAYNRQNKDKLSQIYLILNNYEGILEVYNGITDRLASIGRDCSRYGINLIITCNMPSSMGRRLSQCFDNKYTLHLTDSSDYYGIFNMKVKTKPRDIVGRGVALCNGGIHEFQTASIVDEETVNINDYLDGVANKLREVNKVCAPVIPTLPEIVTLNYVLNDITTLSKAPIGISKNSLKTVKYDFTAFTSTIITSNRLENINSFMYSLLEVFQRITNTIVFFVDAQKSLEIVSSMPNIKYFSSEFTEVFAKLEEFEKNNNQNTQYNIMYVFYGVEKLKQLVEPNTLIGNLFELIKKSENSNIIFCDSGKSLKSLEYETWFSKYKNNADGIWIGKGLGEQQNFRITKLTKEMTGMIPNNYGYVIKENYAEMMKLLEFNEELERDDEEDE